MRPPLITSSIANSSAMRIGGLCSDDAVAEHDDAPTFFVRRASVAAMRFGEGMRP